MQPLALKDMTPSSSSEASPICLFTHLISQQPQDIIMKSDLWSTSATITNSTGGSVLCIEAPHLSRSHRKKVYDTNGTHLFTIRKEDSRLGSSHYFFESPADSHHILEFHSEWIGQSSSKTTATFTNAISHQQEVLQVESATILALATGGIVARINRKAFDVRHTYRLSVVPAVDVALMVGIVMCLDDRERNHEDSRAFSSEVYTI